MATYAGFEAFEEYHRGPLTTVWKARQPGSDQLFAVKVCNPARWQEEGADAAKLLRELGESVEDLSALGGRGARHWVPVLGTGSSGDEAFWVTRFFPRSLERIIAGRLRLSAADVVSIAWAVAKACGEIEAALQRPHGNLKPGNVFVDGPGRLHGSPVFLSDPKPRSAINLPADRTADFQALGRIIVHLTREREVDVNAAIGWPLEPGREWKRLGATGESLRELCNVLLNPSPALGEHDWPSCDRILGRLAMRQRRPWVPLAIAAGALVAAGGGALYLRLAAYENLPHALRPWAERLGNVPKDRTVVTPAWGMLCQAYQEWLGRFIEDARKKAPESESPDQSLNWQQDTYLSANVLKPLLDFESLDPTKIADVHGELSYLKDHPPLEVYKGTVAQNLDDAAHAVDLAKEAFKQWPLRQKLAGKANSFRQRGWTGPAKELQDALDRLSADTLSAISIKEVLRLNGKLSGSGGADTLWDELDRRSGVLNTANDPVMRGISDYFLARGVEAADLGDLDRRLSLLQDESGRWIDWVQGEDGHPRFERDLFASESSLRGFSGPVTEDVLRQWEKEVQNFQFLAPGDDPRQKPDWTQLFGNIDKALAELVDEEKNAPPNSGNAGPASVELQSRRDDAHRALDAMLAKRLVKGRVDAAAAEARGLEAKLRALRGVAGEASMQLRPNTAEWLSGVRRASVGPAGSALNAEWQTRRDQLLSGARPTELTQQVAKFRALQKSYAALKAFFEGISGPAGLGAFPSFDGQGIGGDFAGVMRSWAEERTRKAEASWLRLIPWDGPVPGVSADAFLAEGGAARGAQAQLAADFLEAKKLGIALTEASDRLSEGYGLENASIATLAQWRARPMFDEFGKFDQVRSLVDRIGTLERLRGERDKSALVEEAASPALGIGLAAWRALGAVPGWPAAADLSTEQRIEKDLRSRAQRLMRDESTRASLDAELDRGASDRWHVAFGLAARSQDDASIAATLSQAGTFGVDPSKLSGRDSFNVQLFNLKKVNWRALGGPDAVARRSEAVGRLRATLEAHPDPEASAWLDSIMAISLDEAPGGKSDVRNLGPGTVGWTAETAEDNRRVAYHWMSGGQPRALVFKLVDSATSAPFFICTTTIPVGLVIHIAEDPKVGQRLVQMLEQVASVEDDYRNGPRVWKFDRRRGQVALTLNDSWTGRPLPNWPKTLYPDDLQVPPPTLDDPFQYLPPDAARYIAEDVLGCRLPTPAEWTEIVKQRLAAESAGSHGPNVRDALWKREHDYLVSAGMVNGLPIDGDVFYPSTMTTVKTGREAQAVAPDRNDESLWFEDVGSSSPENFHDLFGNVAQYLYDGSTKQFFVVGGSALSPPEVEPSQAYPVELAFARGGYSDVGMRLAFDAPEGLVNRNRLQLTVHDRLYLHP